MTIPRTESVADAIKNLDNVLGRLRDTTVMSLIALKANVKVARLEAAPDRLVSAMVSIQLSLEITKLTSEMDQIAEFVRLFLHGLTSSELSSPEGEALLKRATTLSTRFKGNLAIIDIQTNPIFEQARRAISDSN